MEEDKLYEGKSSLYFNTTKSVEGKNTIIKELKRNKHSSQLVARYLQNEYNTTNSINCKGLRKVFQIIDKQERSQLLLEHIEGITLNDFFKKKETTDIKLFLEIASKILVIVESIHKNFYIHQKLTSKHILLNEESLDVTIINPSSALYYGKQGNNFAKPEQLQIPATHLAPEQTGRVHKKIDYRTDIYNLGITFYQILSGDIPFSDNEYVSLVHSHLARKPIPLHEVNPQIPVVLSDIVQKMLEKDPEARYQTVYGLLCDINQCLSDIDNTNSITSFRLGQSDIRSQLVIPDKLYGRNKENSQINQLIDRIKSGSNAMLTIKGSAGIGKTSLVHDIKSKIFATGGYLLEGKFGQYNRDTPYSAWIEAFNELTKQILSLKSEELDKWKESILNAVGENGKVLTDILPELELIIGKQPELPELPPVETQNRFNTVFGQFISAMASQEHPVFIFLDDLQWIDSASLNLLNIIIIQEKINHILFIGAFRDNEVNVNHPLYLAFNALKHVYEGFNEIVLKPLPVDAIESLLNDTFPGENVNNKPYAELIHKKTAGNPFFIHQILHDLYQQNIISFSNKTNQWSWDNELLENLEITDNVIELMVSKIKTLNPEAQKILKLAACIGNQFDLSILNIISEYQGEEFNKILQELQGEGLLACTSNTYRFIHDRVQQAAYDMFSDNEKEEVHYNIGRLLYQSYKQDEDSYTKFQITNQLNLGDKKGIPQEDCFEFARLNLESGQKAESNVAYDAALNYFRYGIEFLGEDAWEVEYSVCLQLYTAAVRSAYMCGEYQLMKDFANSIYRQAHNEIEKSPVYEIEIKALAAQEKLLEAIEYGVYALSKLNMDVALEPAWDYVWERFGVALNKLNEVGLDGLEQIPDIESGIEIAQTRILSALGEPAYAAAPNFFILWASEYAIKSLTWKHAVMSPFGFAAFGLALCATGKHIETGHALAKKAVEMIESLEARSSRCRVLNIYGGTIQMWKEPLRNTISTMEKGIAAGYENGDHTSGSYSAFGMSMNLFQMGMQLDSAEKKIAQNLRTIKFFRQDFLWYWVASYLHSIRELKDTSITQPPMENYEQVNWIEEAKKTNNVGGLAHFYLNRLIVDFILSRHENNRKNAELTGQNAAGFQSTISVPAYYHFDSLSTLRLLENGSEIPENVIENQKKIEALCKTAPSNFTHKYYLVEAEIARINKEKWKAAEYYQKAIKNSNENLYLQDEAIAYELAAEFYLNENQIENGNHHLLQAFEVYKKWGAKAKLKQLQEKYPSIIVSAQQQADEIENNSKIDVESIMKASQIISKEMQLDALIDALMKVLIQNIGAQSCYLLQMDENKLTILAEINSEDNQVKRKNIDPEKTGLIPLSIINLVLRLQKPVLINDALQESEYLNDPVIQTNKSRSVLCTPLLAHNELTGLLYFENRLISGAFTEKHLQVLEMLSSQSAISFENARLYEKLLLENEERRINELKYRLLAENTTDIISRHNLKNLEYLYISPSCTFILGHLPEEMVGKTAFDFIHLDDHKLLIEARKEILEKGNITIIFRKLKKNGDYIWVESSNRVISDNATGKVTELVSVSRDITERKSYEESLEQNEYQLKQQNEEYLALNEELSESNTRVLEINEELSKAKNKAEESDRLKSAFLANISHEIRTPMNGILGFAELLKNKTNTSQSTELYIDMINKSGERLLYLINDLVDISKIEAGVTEIIFDSFDLVEVLVENYNLFKIETDAKNIKLMLDNDTNKKFNIHSDRSKINQILSNLLRNAIKFTKEGHISFGYKNLGDSIEIYVKDTGIGIPPEYKDFIFERFRQGETTLSREYEGAGLGLYISKSYTELLHGKIEYESTLNEGTIFQFTIPSHIDNNENQELTQKAEKKEQLNASSKILIVEDDQINFMYLNEVFRNLNFNIKHANNGKEAVEMTTTPNDFDLILMDIKMPEMNGYEATSIIKDKFPNLPIVALTAYAMQGDKEKIERFGFDGYLAKPVKKEELKKLLTKFLK